MLYVFVPYYNEDTPEFKKSLESQTVKYILIKRNRKKSKILWTKAVNDFWRECKRWQGTKDDDVVCIMNNDIEFGEDLFREATKRVSYGYVVMPYQNRALMDWERKKLYEGLEGNTFLGRCFFMTLGDFKESGGFCKFLPHALADIDFGLNVLERKLRIWKFIYSIKHDKHPYEPISKWSLRAYNNPILWTIFLLRHPNRYTFINILKAWYDGLFR